MQNSWQDVLNQKLSLPWLFHMNTYYLPRTKTKDSFPGDTMCYFPLVALQAMTQTAVQLNTRDCSAQLLQKHFRIYG